MWPTVYNSGKYKEQILSHPPEGKQLCLHLDFSLGISFVDV